MTKTTLEKPVKPKRAKRSALASADGSASGYNSPTQQKNLAWMLPRPKPDRYKGGMPLHCERWLVQLCRDILRNPAATVLNIFCGMNQLGTRVDIRPEVKPDICCDAHELTKHVTGCYDIIIADPPYSDEEARDLYGTPKLKYKLWTKEATALLSEGGLLVVYHKYLMPNPNPDIYQVVKRVFIGNRVYHLPRAAIIFGKKTQNK